MQRKETSEKLDALLKSNRRMWTVAGIVFLLAAAALAQGVFGGTDLGETSATVRWDALAMHSKTGDLYSQIRAELPGGKLVQFTSPHTPPPREGDRIVLRVRKNIFGWHTYTWQPG